MDICAGIQDIPLAAPQAMLPARLSADPAHPGMITDSGLSLSFQQGQSREVKRSALIFNLNRQAHES
jgi:hypothetical protein